MKFKIDKILPIAIALLLPGISMYTSTEAPPQEGMKRLFSWAIASAFLYNIWYLVWYLWDIKSSFQNSRYLLRLILLVLGIIGFTVFINRFSAEAFRFAYFVRFLFISCLFSVIQYALKAQKSIAQLQLEKEQIQTENYRTQLKALQTQVDPHFLFNSLNTLRSMIRHQHTNSEQFVMSLGDFYRQTLKHNENTTLQLSRELEVLESYLFLMKSRNEQAVKVDISIEESLYHYHLPTLALQTVVENCFKHNSMSSKMPIHIKVSSNKAYVVVTNNIQPKLGEVASSGYGLDLLKKRYALMNILQGVIFQQTQEQFIVQLKLINQ